jgi:hypothetical protein
MYSVNSPTPNFSDKVRTGDTRELTEIIQQLVKAVKELQTAVTALTGA